ncbi:MAG: hypothetical protein QGG40_21925, partial [Myxococcota bacterium]|nr:hypothetical protein [Myxococcota bacterium]
PAERAAFELLAIVQAASLAEQLPPKQRVGVLLQGIQTAAGPSGHRAHVARLPGPDLDLETARTLLIRYAEDASPLALERVLLSLEPGVDRTALAGILLEVATLPCFVPIRGVLAATTAILTGTDHLASPRARERRAALLSWVLGRRRPPPTPEQQDAIGWLETHATELARPELVSGQRPVDVEQLAHTLSPTLAAPVMDGLLELLVDGVNPTSILDGLSLLCARRFGRLRVNNGGLWDTAHEGIRLCHGLRTTSQGTEGPHLAQSLFLLAFYWLESRWLQPGRAWKPRDAGTPGGQTRSFAESFEALDLTEAKLAALEIGKERGSPESHSRLVEQVGGALLHEDHAQFWPVR